MYYSLYGRTWSYPRLGKSRLLQTACFGSPDARLTHTLTQKKETNQHKETRQIIKERKIIIADLNEIDIMMSYT